MFRWPPKKRLAKMYVSLNETGQNGATFGVDYYVCSSIALADIGNAAILNQQIATQDRVSSIHRDECAAFDQNRFVHRRLAPMFRLTHDLSGFLTRMILKTTRKAGVCRMAVVPPRIIR